MPDVSVSKDIAAPADAVWAMVTDLPRMGEWSPENDGGEWLQGATTAIPGAKFKGVNSNGNKSWTTTATIVDVEPARRFSFLVKVGVIKVADWCYTFEDTDTGCRVTESWTDRRPGFVKPLAKSASGVADRAARNRETMEATLDRLARAAEVSPDA